MQILGGIVRNGSVCCVGAVLSEIGKYSVDKAIIGTNALDVDFGFSTPNHETAEIKRRLIEIAQTTIIMCDHSKIQKRSFCSFAKPSECDYLIVDEGAKEYNPQKLEKEGVQIRYCGE